MKKKNYKCCGKSYKSFDDEKFNNKCLRCKKNNQKNKYLTCGCYFVKNNKVHQGLIRELNTMYMVESKNYIICCEELFEETTSYYQERWDDYYASRF